MTDGRRRNGTRSDASAAGKIPDASPGSAPTRPTVPPGIARRAQKKLTEAISAELKIEPLELRARAWHFEMIGGGCECYVVAGAYPCADCKDEADNLLQLLRAVVDETIAAQRKIMERWADVPRGRRT